MRRAPIGLAGAAATLPAAAAVAAAFALGHIPLAAVILCCSCLGAAAGFIRYPWAILPVAILGGTIASGAIGSVLVTQVIALHVGLMGIGIVSLAVRRTVDPSWGVRVRTPADVPMAVLAAGVGIGSLYGLARGNPSHEVLVAAYEIAVIPAYFFLTTLTLSSAARFRAAGLLYVAGAAGLALAGLGTPGRHGGLFSVLALPPVLVAGTAARGRKRWLLLALAALFGLDVVLSSYRSVWLAAAVALVLLLTGGSPRLRRTAALGFAGAAVVALTATVTAGGFRARAALVPDALQNPSGYRVPEARIGRDAFLANPLVGRGMGQIEPQVFVPGFRLTDVGPVYHVFYVTILANAGLIGLGLVLWPLVAAARWSRDGRGRAYRALLAGFAAAAAFAGPADGHWELGLIPALALLSARFESSGPRPVLIGRTP